MTFRFLDSLIFNDEVDSYASWTLFLIFVSILILISGVVLLTHKKPEPGSLSARATSATVTTGFPRLRLPSRNLSNKNKGAPGVEDEEMGIRMRRRDGDEEGHEEEFWAVGDDDDDDDGEGQDEDVDHDLHPLRQNSRGHLPLPQTKSKSRSRPEEGMGLMEDEDDEDEDEDGVDSPGTLYEIGMNDRSPIRTQRLR